MNEFDNEDNQEEFLIEGIDALLLFKEKSSLDTILDYFEKNLKTLCTDKSYLKKMLAYLHKALTLEIDNNTIDLNGYILNIFHKHNNNDVYIKSLLQILYQILKTIELESLESKTICIKDDTMNVLISILFTTENSTTKANMLTCVQLYVKVYQTTNIIDNIWLKLFAITEQKQNLKLIAQVLVYLCDAFLQRDYHRKQEFTAVLQELLKSKIREERKSAVYILKKVTNLRFKSVSKPMNLKEYQIWVTYIAIFENLEQNQSHLILPSLETLRNIKFVEVSLQKWFDILYIQTLNQPNTLVIRWMLEYIMKKYQCVALSENMLLHFLEASNKTNLYNKEGYFLPDPCEFLKCDNKKFLNAFAQINWKCLPMIYWLDGFMQTRSHWQVSFQILLHIAGKIRCLQNPSLRLVVIKKFNQLFIEDLKSMNLCEFVQLIETLYNISDDFNLHNLFTDKVQSNTQISTKFETIFTQRFYEIYSFELSKSYKTIQDVCRYFSDKPKKQLSWLRFAIVFDCFQFYKNSEDIDFFYMFWRLNLDINVKMLKRLNLTETITYFLDKLMWNNDEKQFICTKSIEFFLDSRIIKFSDMDNFFIKPEDLLEFGSQRMYMQLLDLLSKHNERLQHSVLDNFIFRIKDIAKSEKKLIKAVSNILTYIKKVIPEKLEHYAEIILNFDLENKQLLECVLNYTNKLSKATIIKGVLYGDPKTGDARIEDVYYKHISNIYSRSAEARKRYIQLLYEEEDFKAVFNDLLKENNDITSTKPRYFEHSMEHRLKLRIATTLLCNMKNPNLKLNYEDFWQILLEQNNQLNVTYMYELLTAYFTPNIQVIKGQLEKIGTYTASQQVSVICVTQTYCLLHEISDIDEIIKNLLPLTMGANFQIRLYSQLVIYNLLTEIKTASSAQIAILSAIKSTLGNQIAELLQDVRLQLHILVKASYMDWYYAASSIMYITNASYDEYSIDEKDLSHLLQLKTSYIKKYTSSTKTCDVVQNISSIDSNINNMQRKMDPTNDILIPNTIISYQECADVELYVVASLIDKLPNLGGIARTCEVLGIKNLVLDSKKHIEQNDFKHLSMTAERNLNIMEVKPNDLPDFLIEKQSEGYEIVGAEQTVSSVSFVDFKFPKKCVLLLGHEKEGIPGNLLGFLDFAVEIPQFGEVRSLNVHVTGALFLWEYCKQHIVT